MSFELLFGIVLVIYGAVIIWNRKTTIGIGRPPLFHVHIDGVTAVIFAVGLVVGGSLIAFPSLYTLSGSQTLPDDVLIWIPFLAAGAIVMGVFGAIVSGILRTAKSVGDDIYSGRQLRNKRNKPSADE